MLYGQSIRNISSIGRQTRTVKNPTTAAGLWPTAGWDRIVRPEALVEVLFALLYTHKPDTGNSAPNLILSSIQLGDPDISRDMTSRVQLSCPSHSENSRMFNRRRKSRRATRAPNRPDTVAVYDKLPNLMSKSVVSSFDLYVLAASLFFPPIWCTGSNAHSHTPRSPSPYRSTNTALAYNS